MFNLITTKGNTMLLIDSHCHLDKLNYKFIHKNIDDVLKKALKKNVKIILNISTSINNFKDMIKLIKNKKNIFFSCGIHPLECRDKNYNFNELCQLAKKNYVIAIGETGLDFLHTKNDKFNQIKLFQDHIKLSLKLNKPLIIHTRNSIKEILTILKKEESKTCKGVIHSFTENLSSLYQILDLGFYISLSGIITFKNSNNLRSILNFIPMNRLLIETDSPYLSPIPHRRKENQPSFLYDLAKYISILKKISIEKLALITTNNFKKLFNVNFSAE